ncbi:hypothetical protein DERF_004457, partial [Dermatophagoides farinae]
LMKPITTTVTATTTTTTTTEKKIQIPFVISIFKSLPKILCLCIKRLIITFFFVSGYLIVKLIDKLINCFSFKFIEICGAKFWQDGPAYVVLDNSRSFFLPVIFKLLSNILRDEENLDIYDIKVSKKFNGILIFELTIISIFFDNFHHSNCHNHKLTLGQQQQKQKQFYAVDLSDLNGHGYPVEQPNKQIKKRIDSLEQKLC